MKHSRIILIRHCHRHKTGPRGRKANNGLSSKGKIQANRIQAFFSKHVKDPAPMLISSPLKRCTETIAPLSALTHQPVTLTPGILEQGEKESQREFESRLKIFWEELLSQSFNTCVICGHGDLFPVISQLVFGLSIELKKGGWIEMTKKGNTLSLREIRQKI
jgi:broad specificity phosphatase PhoE